MKPAEAKVLEGLRKSTLAYLSEKEYAEVVEAVEKQGILGLTGAASRLVKGAVAKHGSHDQKTHGRKGGGGGGGSGGGGSAKQGLTEQQFKEANKLTLVAGSAAGEYTDATEEREGEWLMAAGGSLSDRDDLDLSGVNAEDRKTYSNFKLGEEKIVRSLDTFNQARKTPVSTNKVKLLEKGYKDLGEGLALTSGVMSNAEMSGVENALTQLGSFLQEAGVDIP